MLRMLTRRSWRGPDRRPCTLFRIWTTLPLCVTLIGITSPAAAQTISNFCALLPEADVGAIVGTPMKLSAKPVETNKVGGGTVRGQECVYDAIANRVGAPQVRIGMDEASSPALATEWFKEQAELYDKFMAGPNGKGQPLKGLGDQAFSYPGGSIYMRKQSMSVHVTIFSNDSDHHLEQSKQLAQKAVARVK